MSSGVAQQIFFAGTGIAGVLSGLILARDLAEVKDVPAPLVAGTTAFCIILTVGAGLYLTKKAREM